MSVTRPQIRKKKVVLFLLSVLQAWTLLNRLCEYRLYMFYRCRSLGNEDFTIAARLTSVFLFILVQYTFVFPTLSWLCTWSRDNICVMSRDYNRQLLPYLLMNDHYIVNAGNTWWYIKINDWLQNVLANKAPTGVPNVSTGMKSRMYWYTIVMHR